MAAGSQDRAITPIIGAVLLIGFLIAGMAIHQAQVVPHQNKEIEFNHNERVQDDLVHVRNAILEAHESGEDQFVTVELGTTYPARLVGINPPSPRGTLRSTSPAPLVVKDSTGTEVTSTICPGGESSRFIEYEPGYNEYLRAPLLRYENSLVYKQFSRESTNLTMTGQQLVSGSTINIYRITGNYSLQGQGAVSFDVKAGSTQKTQLSDPTLVLPTQLPESKWEEILEGEVDPADVSVADGNLTVTPAGSFEVECSPVEVSSQESQDTGTETPTPTATPTSSAPQAIFDNGANSNVFVVGVSQPYGPGSTNPKIDVTFENRGGQSKTVVAARLLTYYDAATGRNKPVPAQLRVAQTTPWLNESDPRQSLDSSISISAGGQRAVEFYFKGEDGADSGVDLDDYMIVTFEYDDGTASVYFVEFDGSN